MTWLTNRHSGVGIEEAGGRDILTGDVGMQDGAAGGIRDLGLKVQTLIDGRRVLVVGHGAEIVRRDEVRREGNRVGWVRVRSRDAGSRRREMDFDMVQGFLFAKPMTAQKFALTSLRKPVTIPD